MGCWLYSLRPCRTGNSSREWARGRSREVTSAQVLEKIKVGPEMLNSIKRFKLNENCLEAIEWEIVGRVIAVAAAALFLAIGLDSLPGLAALGVETSLIP